MSEENGMKVLRKGTALLLSVAMIFGLVAGGLLIRSIADTAMQWQGAELDDLSRFYETGNARSPGMISTVAGDAGGKSYGMYMFASKAGTPHAFAEWCKNNFTDGSTYHDIGVTLDSAYHYISDGYGAYFDSAWENMAEVYGAAFASAQYEYTKATIYENVVDRVESAVPAFNIDNYSVALKNVFWSRAVQHGASDASSLIQRAFAALGGFANQPEAQLIQAIYAECGRLVTADGLRQENGKTGPTMSGNTANKYGTAGLILRYFYGCSGDVQMSVYRRLAVNEPADALVMLMNNGYYEAAMADGNYRLLYNTNQNLALDGTNGTVTLNAKGAEGSSQVFSAAYYAGGFYTFSIEVGGQTLRLSAEGGTVKLAAPSASASQMWELTQGGSGWLLKNKSTGTYLSVKDNTLVMVSEGASAWQMVAQAASVSDWTLSGVIYPNENSGLMEKASSFPVRGVISCSAQITSVNITILTGSGSTVITQTVSPNATSYDLKRLDDRITYSTLSKGDYTFVLTAAADGKSTELVRSNFTVKPYDGSTTVDETFLVTFDPQGGKVNGSTTKRVSLDDIVYGELPTASRDGAQFLGWYTADGEEILESTPVRAANLTLYAHYAGMHTYTFLDANGSRYASGTAAAGELITAPSVPPVKLPDAKYSYTFKGWENYTAGVTVMGDADMTFKPLYDAVPLSDVTDPIDPNVDYWLILIPGSTVDQLNSGDVVYRDGKQVTSGLLGTGMTVVSEGKTFAVIVVGDANGDGRITITDVVAMQSHVVGKKTLEGAYALAVDLNGDGKITVTDVVKAARIVVGKDTIS